MGIRHINGIIAIYKGGMPNIVQMDLVQCNEMKEMENYAHSQNMSIIGAREDSLINSRLKQP